jgi:hypothetical protein
MQIDVANQMAAMADERNISFVISLGDNFYNAGIYDLESDRFEVMLNSHY